MCKRKGNIKLGVKEVGCVDMMSTRLAPDRDQRGADVNAVIYLRFS